MVSAALFFVLFLVGCASSPSPALAMDAVSLRRGDLGKEREFLEKFARDWGGLSSVYIPRKKDLYVGRFDLNEDGQYELFAFYQPPYDTGTAPLFVSIFQKIAGKWTGIGIVPPLACSRRTCTIEVSQERFHGWRTILGHEYGLRFGAWADEHIRGARLEGRPVVEHSYVGICFTDHCAREQEESYWGPLVERPKR